MPLTDGSHRRSTPRKAHAGGGSRQAEVSASHAVEVGVRQAKQRLSGAHRSAGAQSAPRHGGDNRADRATHVTRQPMACAGAVRLNVGTVRGQARAGVYQRAKPGRVVGVDALTTPRQPETGAGFREHAARRVCLSCTCTRDINSVRGRGVSQSARLSLKRLHIAERTLV